MKTLMPLCYYYPGLSEGAALGSSRIPQHGERVNESGELLPAGTSLPRTERLRPGVPVLLPVNSVLLAQLRSAVLRPRSDVYLQGRHQQR